MIHALCI